MLKSKRLLKIARYGLWSFCLLAALVTLMTTLDSKADWRTASRDSAGIAPAAGEFKPALVQIYAARAYSWRGYFGLHMWLAFKERNADHYMVTDVVGWRQYRGVRVVDLRVDLPDRQWFGNRPSLIFELSGESAERAIPKIRRAVESYPYPNTYHLWPGPNSNTYIAHLVREVDELRVALPANAIGKDFLGGWKVFARSPTKTGWQFSAFGVFGLTLGLRDGMDVNLLGLNFGIDVLRPALKLPFVGRIGMTSQ